MPAFDCKSRHNNLKKPYTVQYAINNLNSSFPFDRITLFYSAPIIEDKKRCRRIL